MADDTPKEEKTEEATPRAREEAREKGNVGISQEFIAAVMLVGAGITMTIAGPALFETMGRTTASTTVSLGHLGTGTITVHDAAAIIRQQVVSVAAPLGLTIGPMLVIGALAGYGQIGFRFTPKALQFNFSKMDPVKGIKRMFGARGAVRLGLAMLKLTAITTAIAVTTWLQLPRVLLVAGNEIGPALRGGMTIMFIAATAAVIVVLLISVLDLIYQRQQHSKDLRMSKQEIKREHKQDEGDPKLKARVRQIQREMATSRMMADVPKATVIVTNPTHYAVALYYEPDESGAMPAAPRVLAKGLDDVAQRIKALATEADVPLYEDVPLARGLYANADVGEIVPAAFFEAVATVIQYVWRLRGRHEMPEEQSA